MTPTMMQYARRPEHSFAQVRVGKRSVGCAKTNGTRAAWTEVPYHDAVVAFCATGALELPTHTSWTGEYICACTRAPKRWGRSST